MQETHLKKDEKTNILSTLRSFMVGDSENIMFEDSRIEISSWRARYGLLKRDGLISGKYRFHSTTIGDKQGTLIVREA